MAHSSGIAPKASMDLLSRQAGGRENKKQAEDPNFTYAIQVDVEDLITNIILADARMKVYYDRFGDVVCFDTTYHKNKESRLFAIFIGVNHHKQTIIFGGAMLYDETIETFEWLFDTFSRTMSGKKPSTILTDQDAAMDKALSTQWPETKHRHCVWHMYQNEAKHLSSIFDKFKSFVKEFSSCVYDHDEVFEFTRAWDDMLEKYNLKDNEWLKNLYENKKKWALVYGRETFSADMSTTQRSESMNNKSLLDDRRCDESKADTKSSISMSALPYPAEILKHAASIYTLEVFKIFHEKVWKTWNCNIEILEECQTLTEYKVNHNNLNSSILQSDFGGMSESHCAHQVNVDGSNLLELNSNSMYNGSATEVLMLNSSIQSFGSSVLSSYNTFPSQYTFQPPFLNTMQDQSTIRDHSHNIFTWTSDNAAYADLSNLQSNI
ncbi:protein FAR1-RELATED SEQUENCE 5-like [Apium graveolens]|uniref:protein FAR1-RELATED SEQUENCE 5-like n=1 Tax=Apium graveolens TaxID=4045 RepID=UPI003D7A270D